MCTGASPSFRGIGNQIEAIAIAGIVSPMHVIAEPKAGADLFL
jgi:hypothetical protein